MNDSRYRWMLYIIVVVILGTIGIQVYWNYKNYHINKQQLINDVQVSLDNAVDTYYANLAERSALGFAIESNSQAGFFRANEQIDSIFKHFEISQNSLDSIDLELIDGVSMYKEFENDTLIKGFHHIRNQDSSDSQQLAFKWRKGFNTDSINKNDISLLTSKVFISITNDSLSLKKIDSLLGTELNRKNLNIDYGLSFDSADTSVEYLNTSSTSKSLSTVSKSPFLPKNSILSIHFSNETKIILRRILSGILISTILVLAVIGCLFYLLKIIKHQKQLAEVKNDLISNITHEFKTPIATISVALESIKSFNVIDDKEKTKTYLDMSSDQLSKLNIMVEKLLETATLDSENLELNKEKINIVEVLYTIIEKHQLQTETKTISFNPSSETIMATVDVFHFDNALNNIIDNALKYGGDEISVNINQNSFAFTINVSDTGETLTKANKDQIFEKFYRVSKGNTHDVKGFGIGLYYTKKIIEKHGGTIQTILKDRLTTFKLSLPNG
ncbi:two-component sensor histidine kinase [Flavobacteriales bacterium 34_180_T64]|nr:two-component sensor histidine kinase [Flavobacteriales bacterium 34_180_T64]